MRSFHAEASVSTRRSSRRTRSFRYRLPLLAGLLILGLVGLRIVNMVRKVQFQGHRRQVIPWTEIYRGVHYTSRRLPDSPQGGGMMYMVRVDLNVPGTSIYLRPYFKMESDALSGFYHLKYPWQFVKREHLAVTVNGTFFAPLPSHRSLPGPLRSLILYGELASQAGPIVINHHVAGTKAHGVFIWWGDDLTPHMKIHSWKQNLKDLEIGRFAVANWYPLVQNGQLGNDAEPAATDKLHARTALGIATGNKLIYLAAFEHASLLLVARQLSKAGVPDAIAFDGGGSSCMTIGEQARNIKPGTVLGGLRPVGSVFGIRVVGGDEDQLADRA